MLFRSHHVVTKDAFTRIALYGNYMVMPKKLNLLAGYERGRDSLTDSTVAGGTTVGTSNGYFGEVDLHTSEKLAFALRYDLFDPSKKVSNNSQKAITLSGNYALWNGLQFVGDIQTKTTEKGAAGNNKDTALTARLIYIW